MIKCVAQVAKTDWNKEMVFGHLHFIEIREKTHIVMEGSKVWGNFCGRVF